MSQRDASVRHIDLDAQDKQVKQQEKLKEAILSRRDESRVLNAEWEHADLHTICHQQYHGHDEHPFTRQIPQSRFRPPGRSVHSLIHGISYTRRRDDL